jgi:hypothetical protein
MWGFLQVVKINIDLSFLLIDSESFIEGRRTVIKEYLTRFIGKRFQFKYDWPTACMNAMEF